MRVFFVIAVFVAFLIYSSGLWAPYHLDDPTVIKAAGKFGWSTRPLGYASFWLTEKLALLAGPMFPWTEPFYHRVINVVIHVVAATALFWLVRLLSEQWITAAVAGALFLVHPIQTQAVTYISQRFESQAAMFMFLAAGAYVRFRKGGRWPWLLSAVIFAGAAALTKETAVVLPLWLLFIEVVFFGVVEVRKRAIYFVPLALILLVPAWRALQESRTTLTWISWDRYFASQGPVLVKYFELSTWPRQQFLFYDFQPVAALSSHVAFQWLLVIAIAGLGIFLLKRHRLIAFGVLSFFVLLLPVIVLPLPDLIFEHRLYPAFAGVAIAFAGALSTIHRKSVLAVAGVVLVLLSVKTVMRNGQWNDAIAFLEGHRQAFPQDPSILSRLASYYFLSGRVNKSLELNLEARRYEDRYNTYYRQQGHLLTSLNLAGIYLAKGNPAAAKVEALRAIAAKPTQPEAWRALGQAELELHEYDNARRTFEKLIILDPSAASWSSLEVAYNLLGDTSGVQMAARKVAEQLNSPEINDSSRFAIPQKYRPYVLFAVTVALLGWLVFSAWTVLTAVRCLLASPKAL